MAVRVEASSSSTKARDKAAIAAGEKIKPIKKLRKRFKMVLYGRNKLGKTVYACSSGLKTLVIDCNERGSDSVVDYENVDIFELTRWDELDPIYWFLRGGKHDYEVIVIDTVTMLASVGMKWVLKDDLERDMSIDPLYPSKQSYLKLGEMMKDAIIKFRNLPYHIVYNAQEKVTTNEDEEGNTETQVHPELSPGQRSQLLSATNIIGRIYVREVDGKKGKKKMQRRILFGAHPKYISGNRFKSVKRVEVLRPEPYLNFKELMERVYGG